MMPSSTGSISTTPQLMSARMRIGTYFSLIADHILIDGIWMELRAVMFF